VLWLCWAIAAAASVQLAPNPVYVAVVIAISAVIVEGHAVDGPLRGAFPVVLLAGVAFAVLRLVLTVLTTHGVGEILFRLPQTTLPRIVGGFTVGGTVELPVVARAAAEGWALLGILAAFGAFNAVVSHYELVQSAPRAFYEVGLAVTVALAFVPSTIAAVGAVREADRARTGGRVVRRGRLLRQVVPILETGMERAVALAESMDSRGFGHGRTTTSDTVAGWLTLLALLSLAASFVALVARATGTATLVATVGVAALVGAVGAASRSTARRRYRRRRLTTSERLLAAATCLSPVGLALLAARGDATLAWPGEQLRLPGISAVALVALATLAAPALLQGSDR
jgi:energy-coupling factor transport system permease protein